MRAQEPGFRSQVVQRRTESSEESGRSGGATITRRVRNVKSGNSWWISDRPTRRTSRLPGLLNAKSNQRNLPPGTSTREISFAICSRSARLSTEVNKRNCKTRSKLPSENGNCEALLQIVLRCGDRRRASRMFSGRRSTPVSRSGSAPYSRSWRNVAPRPQPTSSTRSPANDVIPAPERSFAMALSRSCMALRCAGLFQAYLAETAGALRRK